MIIYQIVQKSAMLKQILQIRLALSIQSCFFLCDMRIKTYKLYHSYVSQYLYCSGQVINLPVIITFPSLIVSLPGFNLLAS